MPRYPVDPAQSVRAGSPAGVRTAWASGALVGPSKHQLIIRVRPGVVERDYVETKRIDTGEDVLMQTIVASPSQYPPWVGTWTPLGDWRTLPNIQSEKHSRGFDQNGSSTATIVMDNIVFEDETGVAGVFHDIKRGFFSPSRGVVVSTRASLWDDTGWTNALNGGYQIEVWEGYGPDGDPRCIPLDTPDPTTHSCAPADALISRTWTGIIETVDLESHPDHITLTARDFGVLFTDQRLQGTNKAAEIVAPTTFADESHSRGIRPYGPEVLLSRFLVRFNDEFYFDHLSDYQSVTGTASIDTATQTLMVGAGGATIVPGVWCQGGKFNLGVPSTSGGAPFIDSWALVIPGICTVSMYVTDHTTGAANVKVEKPDTTVLLDHTSFPLELDSPIYVYWDASGTVKIGSHNFTTGVDSWPFVVSGLDAATEAVQPYWELSAKHDGSDAAYGGSTLGGGAALLNPLQMNSDQPITLPGDLLSTHETGFAATVGSASVSSSYVGASTKDYDGPELWLSDIQSDPLATQHIDIPVSRAWSPPSRWLDGAVYALNDLALAAQLNPFLDADVYLAPGAPLEVGTTTTDMPAGTPVSSIDTTALTEDVIEFAGLQITDPTGAYSEIVGFAVTTIGDYFAAHAGDTSIGSVSWTPSFDYPVGSKLTIVSTAPTYAGLGQFRLFTMTPLWSGMEMWVSLHMDSADGTMDGKPLGVPGWVDLGYGDTPDGVPFLLHTTLDIGAGEGGPLTFDLGHVFDTGNLWDENTDGSINGGGQPAEEWPRGLKYSDSPVPGATLRITFRSLQTGPPLLAPDTKYMVSSDLTALEAALTPGNYIAGVQNLWLFGFYPWSPGTVALTTLSEAITVAGGAITSLPVAALQQDVPKGTPIYLVDSVRGVQQWVVAADAAVGDTTISTLSNTPFEDLPEGTTVAGTWFVDTPPAALTVGVPNLQIGALQEIDSYPDGAGVAGDVGAVHWVLVNDAIEVIEVLCKWAGFKEWNLEWFGWSLVNPMQYGSDKFFIDVINDILAQGNFVFFIDGPTDDDRSIGIPCFVHQAAIAAAPPDIIEVTDQNLLETVEVKWDLSQMPYVLRYRGNPVPPDEVGTTYEEDLVPTYAATYYPPWAGDDYVPLDGSAPPFPRLRRTAGVVRHFTQTVGVNVPIGMNSNEQCLFACLLAAMQYLLAMGTGHLQIPGMDGFSLNQQISVIDEADGINSRLWLASVENDHTLGPQGRWLMVLGGSYIDTEDAELVLADYDYATTQVRPQQPTGEQYVGLPVGRNNTFVDGGNAPGTPL
jgi:hypothetical protein